MKGLENAENVQFVILATSIIVSPLAEQPCTIINVHVHTATAKMIGYSNPCWGLVK